jgi:hypothetical protein
VRSPTFGKKRGHATKHKRDDPHRPAKNEHAVLPLVVRHRAAPNEEWVISRAVRHGLQLYRATVVFNLVHFASIFSAAPVRSCACSRRSLPPFRSRHGPCLPFAAASITTLHFVVLEAAANSVRPRLLSPIHYSLLHDGPNTCSLWRSKHQDCPSARYRWTHEAWDGPNTFMGTNLDPRFYPRHIFDSGQFFLHCSECHKARRQ